MSEERGMTFEQCLIDAFHPGDDLDNLFFWQSAALAQSLALTDAMTRIVELEEALKPFAEDWEAYLEVRRKGEEQAFCDWQYQWRDIDDIAYAQAFAALHPAE